MRVVTLPVLLLAACHPEADDTAPPAAERVDLTSALGPGEARAGQIAEESALLGGVSAEGQVGDYKLMNDRVAFVIQGIRRGSFMVQDGGGVIDADLVRPAGQPGRDLADEWMPMAGTGHLCAPTTITVVEDGTTTGRGVIRVEGDEAPMAYLVGALEAPDLIPDEGLHFVTEYILPADSWLLGVRTTVTATKKEVTTLFGDVMLGSEELGTRWFPGSGLDGPDPTETDRVFFVGNRNDLALGILGAPGETYQAHPALTAFSGLISAISLFSSTVTLEKGAEATFMRFWGVAPDVATLTDAWLAQVETASEASSGTVEAPDGPVEGARVTVLADGSPWSMAVTDGDGAFSAQVPAGATVSWVADGHGDGLFPDLPPGAGAWGPYASATAKALVLDSFDGGAEPVPLARGRGWTSGTTSPLLLQEPGTVSLRAPDGLPFEARIVSQDDADPGDGAWVQRGPWGYAAAAWARDGDVEIDLEPGNYGIMAWRGVRHEAFSGTFSVVAGQETPVDVVLPEAIAPPGWVTVDTHVHAAPSPDGGISMEERVIVSAGVGLDFHVGTDHEHIADYRPLVAPLGLAERLQTIPGNEMSSLVRGHLNLFPLEPDPTLPNGGAYLWYETIPASTTEEMDALHAAFPGALIQANHPMSGLASAADWSPGVIGNGEAWSDDFDLVEVGNGGNPSAQAFYLDLARRGYPVAPTSVSDSHDHFGGGFGFNVTWVWCGQDGPPSACTPDQLTAALLARHTVASSGVFLDLSILPGSEVQGSAVLDVAALGPAWVQVDSLSLLRDGQVVETLAGAAGSFSLDPDRDAVYNVLATGAASMAPVTGDPPWALSADLRVDPEGDGWAPPLGPLTVSD